MAIQEVDIIGIGLSITHSFLHVRHPLTPSFQPWLLATPSAAEDQTQPSRRPPVSHSPGRCVSQVAKGVA
jgi:hypothetical protein